MMIIFTTLKRILFWSYERGTWQYDVMCVLILAFIFFSPNRFFQNERPVSVRAVGSPVYVSRDEIDELRAGQVPEQIARRLSQKEGHQVAVRRIEVELDDSGRIKGYWVWVSPGDNR